MGSLQSFVVSAASSSFLRQFLAMQRQGERELALHQGPSVGGPVSLT
eukprot:CAMPEP_0172456934 /NCGR_PEP_ID=MMETSP1065-20121228/18607_1 /TAXON_ID=265537 /ORGANISM="Amphiprora paludosa, Strain CCMP125" /LENGTH=46 /DNA_ID= /DNA_START= /DNA_END= /DNA_ORIENTATION=